MASVEDTDSLFTDNNVQPSSITGMLATRTQSPDEEVDNISKLLEVTDFGMKDSSKSNKLVEENERFFSQRVANESCDRQQNKGNTFTRDDTFGPLINNVTKYERKGFRYNGKQGKFISPQNSFKGIDDLTFQNDSIYSLFPKWIHYVSSTELNTKQLFIFEIGPKRDNIDKETTFINMKSLTELLKCKSYFDEMDVKREFLAARKHTNPFEAIAKGIFQNRAAMKLANIDAMLNFTLSSPNNGLPVKSNETFSPPYYFADICGGPGGFSEYILFRNEWKSKGFGLTLKGECDFQIDDFLAGTPETFEPFYGDNEDGDITSRQNILSFQKYVLQVSNKQGVYLVMGDGGFSVEGQENIQEILSKQLILCQFLCATSILQNNGYFVCKTFDVFTPFTVGLIYLMYICFDKISLLKPCTSRPANSERFLIGLNFKLREGKQVFDYLLDVNDKINELKCNEEDIIHVIPLNIINEDKQFFAYIREHNELFVKNQIIALKSLLKHYNH